MKAKTIYSCAECGYESAKWLGKCPSCGSWNSFIEEIASLAPAKSSVKSSLPAKKNSPVLLSKVDTTEDERLFCGIGELDSVLGGGLVKGSLVLVGGDPGIGKSTLLLQLARTVEKETSILYVSGEESEKQLKMRADRLGIDAPDLSVLSETDITSVLHFAVEMKPDILIVDSVQTMYNAEIPSAPGSVSQVRDVTLALMKLAKDNAICVFLVGHVTKDGAIAGPKVLEHMVDCVLYFEGDQNSSYRLLRAAKNRFGSTNEIGVFEMRDTGLVEVPNPSQMLLEGRPEGASGTCVACVMEGTRPVLAEVQALVSKTSFNVPRRTADGFDFNRAALLLAVAEKRAGLKLSVFDAYINVIGGLRLDEPAADLPVVLAVASSYRDAVVADDLVAIGEVGLTGEIRSVSHMNQRLSEVARLGFKKCIVPKGGAEKLDIPAGLTVYRVRNIREAIEVAM